VNPADAIEQPIAPDFVADFLGQLQSLRKHAKSFIVFANSRKWQPQLE
jgi:hypothetical protein